MYGMRKGGKKPRPTRSTARDTGSNHTRWCTTSSIVYIVECAGDTFIKSSPSVRRTNGEHFGTVSVGRLCVVCLGVWGGAVISSTVRIHSSERQRTRERVWAMATNAKAIDNIIVLNIWIYANIFTVSNPHARSKRTPDVIRHAGLLSLCASIQRVRLVPLQCSF